MYFLKNNALKQPKKLCLDDLSYGQVYNQVLVLAHKLKKRLHHVQRVAILSENSKEFALMLLALFLLKKEVLTLNIKLTELEIQKQLLDLDIDFIITSDNFSKNKIQQTQTLQFSIVFAEEYFDSSDEFDWEMLENQIAVIMNTSATSGQFKSVPLTWGQILAHVQASAQVLGVDEKDNWLIFLPIFHVSGLMILLRSLYNNTAVTILEKYEEEAVLAKINAKNINMISIVPTLLSRMIDKITEHNLRVILLGGEFIPLALAEKSQEKKLPLYKTYGMTEHISQISTFNIMEHRDKIDSVGKALPTVEIQIRNAQKDGVGEIWIKSPMLMQNYLNFSANKLDGFFNTDDFGYLDQDGFLYLLNRRKDLIISGGENIYPKEIEDLLYALPQVQECAILGQSDEKWGQIPILHLVSSLDDKQIIKYLTLNLARFKLPKQIVRHQSLPKNSMGKILREKLRKY